MDSSLYDDEYKEEEQCDNSNSPSSSDKCDCSKMLVVEVLSQEEYLCDD